MIVHTEIKKMKKNKRNHQAKGYTNAIIVIKKQHGAYYSPSLLATHKDGKLFAKYHNIKWDRVHVDKFALFASRFPGAWYINFYGTIDRLYKGRKYLIT